MGVPRGSPTKQATANLHALAMANPGNQGLAKLEKASLLQNLCIPERVCLESKTRCLPEGRGAADRRQAFMGDKRK